MAVTYLRQHISKNPDFDSTEIDAGGQKQTVSLTDDEYTVR